MISQSVDKRRDLLAAALRLFVQHGFHGTPTSKIAKEAGVANGTLFHYYKTKEDLVVSLYIDIKSRMSEYIWSKAEMTTDIKERFRIQFTEVLAWALQNQDEFYFIQQFHTSPFAGLLSPEEIKKQISRSCHEIEEAMQSGTIKSRDIEFVLSVMSSHLFGISQYLTKAKLTDVQKQKVIDDGFDMLWAMIA